MAHAKWQNRPNGIEGRGGHRSCGSLIGHGESTENPVVRAAWASRASYVTTRVTEVPTFAQLSGGLHPASEVQAVLLGPQCREALDVTIHVSWPECRYQRFVIASPGLWQGVAIQTLPCCERSEQFKWIEHAGGSAASPQVDPHGRLAPPSG